MGSTSKVGTAPAFQSAQAALSCEGAAGSRETDMPSLGSVTFTSGHLPL